MKFGVKFKIENGNMPLDKHKMLTSVLKSALSKEDRELFDKFYPRLEKGERGINEKKDFLRKDFTSSMYLGNYEIDKKNLEIKLKKGHFFANFSFASDEEGLRTFISFVNCKAKKDKFYYNSNSVRYELSIENIKMQEEPCFEGMTEASFKTLSPILIMNDEGNKGEIAKMLKIEKNKEKAKEIRRMLNPTLDENKEKEKAVKILRERIIRDLNLPQSEEIEITDLNFKSTAVFLYKKNVPCSFGTFKIKARKEILEYISKAGVGSKRSLGFGYIEKI